MGPSAGFFTTSVKDGSINILFLILFLNRIYLYIKMIAIEKHKTNIKVCSLDI